jgi:crossover junction endodeoxyribonuclease RuvC
VPEGEAGLILGVDPGIATTGVAVLRGSGSARVLDHVGVITTPADRDGPYRLSLLHQELTALLARHRPASAAVEQLFFASNSTTAMRVAEARGVILLALAQAGVPTWEYTPMQVKQSLTGYGKATKAQVTKMVRAILEVKGALPDDAFDAVAIALCHAQASRLMPARRLS